MSPRATLDVFLGALSSPAKVFDFMTIVLDGRATSATIREELREQVAAFRERTGVQPKLAAVLVGDDPASQVYVGNKAKACEAAGMAGSVDRLPESVSEQELIDLVGRLNDDPAVHGILVQLPLPKQIDATRILDLVHPLKDVDCFHPENVGRLCQGRPRYLPCTPFGMQTLLALTLIASALGQAEGNVAEAARALQTDRANLYRRMRRLGLDNAKP